MRYTIERARGMIQYARETDDETWRTALIFPQDILSNMVHILITQMRVSRQIRVFMADHAAEALEWLEAERRAIEGVAE
ncbi:MAG: hypothetical protein KC496_03225 [Anaerolineae bacterium]|nr:hypothetical protein [Anaerolineae bacterium]